MKNQNNKTLPYTDGKYLPSVLGHLKTAQVVLCLYILPDHVLSPRPCRLLPYNPNLDIIMDSLHVRTLPQLLKVPIDPKPMINHLNYRIPQLPPIFLSHVPNVRNMFSKTSKLFSGLAFEVNRLTSVDTIHSHVGLGHSLFFFFFSTQTLVPNSSYVWSSCPSRLAAYVH